MALIKDRAFYLRMPRWLADEITARAAKAEISASEYCRQAIEERLDANASKSTA